MAKTTPLTDIAEELKASLLSTKKDDTFYALAEEWRKEYDVVTHEDVYEDYLEEYFTTLETASN